MELGAILESLGLLNCDLPSWIFIGVVFLLLLGVIAFVVVIIQKEEESMPWALVEVIVLLLLCLWGGWDLSQHYYKAQKECNQEAQTEQDNEQPGGLGGEK